MNYRDIIANLLVLLITIGFPILLILLLILPLLIIKIRKKKYTIMSIMMSIIVGIILVAVALFAAYWGLVYLQGLAFLEIYGS